MTGIMGEIVAILTDGIVAVGDALGQGLSSIASSVFLTTAEGGTPTLSTFGSLIVIFAGISLALGLARWVINFCTSLGARNR